MLTHKNKNIFFVILIRHFYFFVKFIYTRLRVYNLVKIFRPGIYDTDFESLDRYFELMHKYLKKFKFKFKNAHVMELGPGNSFVIPYNFLRLEAKKIILIDKYPRQYNTIHQRTYSLAEYEYFKKKYQVDSMRYFNLSSALPHEDFISYMAGDFVYLDFPDKFDLIYSIAVLQHIQDLESSIKKMSLIIKKGGLMFHVVDFKDKWHFLGRPFAFYRYSDKTWNNYLTDASLTYTNRIRYDDYIKLFKKYGFTILWQQTWEFPVNEKKINQYFAGRNDLHIGDAHFLLKKN
jgi:SAM-dependent methyltransferase